MAVYWKQTSWHYDFWKGKIRHQKGGYPTKQEARSAEAEARKNLSKINTDFIGLCESRLKDLEKRRTKKHFRENQLLIENLILLWGKKKEISRQDIEDYLDTKSSPYVVNRELRFIKALFNHGLEKELIGYNPAQRIKLYPITKTKKYIPPRADIDKVLNQAPPSQKLYLLAVINTMGRISEINRLKWEDVHDDYLILWTRKARNSDLTPRKIPLNDTLQEVLKAMPKISEYVFCYTTGLRKGEPYGYRRKMLLRLCEKGGVKVFGYHALRHYGASVLANAGIPLTDIQALLGHQRTTTTDIYLQSIRGGLKEAVKKLESLS
jgi:integrase